MFFNSNRCLHFIVLIVFICAQCSISTKFVRRLDKKRYVGYVLFKKESENEASYLMLKPDWQQKWVLPEGRVRFGETRQKAVKRILREAVGLLTGDIALGIPEHTLQPENKTTYWIASLCNEKPVKLHNQYVEYKWCDYNEAYDLADRLTKQLLKEAQPYVK